MERYGNLSKDSGVRSYALRRDGIAVEFLDRSVYLYTHASAGKVHIAEMEKRARAGRGLSTYISQNKPPYAGKLR